MPNVNINDDNCEDLLQHEIMATRVIDLEIAKSKIEGKIEQLVAKLDVLSMNFIKLDAENEIRKKEYKDLKLEIIELKNSVKGNDSSEEGNIEALNQLLKKL